MKSDIANFKLKVLNFYSKYALKTSLGNIQTKEYFLDGKVFMVMAKI